MRDYEKNGKDPEKNPAVKLIDHFEAMYGKEKTGDIKFEIKTAEEHSSSLRKSPRLIEDGYIKKFVKVWLERWEGEGKGLQVGSSG